MKVIKKSLLGILALVMLCVPMFAFTGCDSKYPYIVLSTDAVIEVNQGATVAEALSGITLTYYYLDEDGNEKSKSGIAYTTQTTGEGADTIYRWTVHYLDTNEYMAGKEGEMLINYNGCTATLKYKVKAAA